MEEIEPSAIIMCLVVLFLLPILLCRRVLTGNFRKLDEMNIKSYHYSPADPRLIPMHSSLIYSRHPCRVVEIRPR